MYTTAFSHLTSSSSLSPSNTISCPSPSHTTQLASTPNTATPAKPHHTAPTTPPARPCPYRYPHSTGPIVRAALLTLCPSPCIVPSTLGCGVQLLIRIVCPGSANVRPSTWNSKTPTIANQIAGPPFGPGGGAPGVVGTTERYGTRKYVSGKK
ncbi:hypothetical protein CGLO_15521 [Colletotrichum gloeosporioides Cg-14]|uniref:Uncharacterized protein n=1 Tax=Colletotrichum gloeosporioides (strain Cg-14) TaxID=1237896 RepID=T0L1X2_COLGC|nr:hypothetical protein CGLO_15521 [Colletotrichum gloeosporioides Cg-14]